MGVRGMNLGVHRAFFVKNAHLFLNSPQGMLALVLNCIDRLNIYNSVAHFAGIAREESGMAWKEILNLLYKLLGEYTHSASSRGRCARLNHIGC